MSILEFWNDAYEIVAVIGTFMGVFGIPSVAVLYNRALHRQMEFSPALAYAYTYFNNFIVPVHDRLASDNVLRVDGAEVDKLFVRMPRKLADVSSGRLRAMEVELEQQHDRLKEVAVQTTSGKRTLKVRCREDERIAFDVPRIVASMEPIITEHLGESRAGESARWIKVEEREIQNFCKQIRKLIKQNGYQQRVKVFDCEVIHLTPTVDDLETKHDTGELPRLWRTLASRLKKLVRR